MKYMLVFCLLVSVAFGKGKKDKSKTSKKSTAKQVEKDKTPSNWKHKHTVGTELRQFSDDAKDNTTDMNTALVGENISSYEKDHFRFIADIHVKYDPTDNNRNLINVRNLFVSKDFGTTIEEEDSFDEDVDLFEDELGVSLDSENPAAKKKPESKDVRVLFGWQIHNWTSMRKFSPADTVNSHIFDGVMENPAKKGEFTISIEKKYSNTRLTGYIFPKVEKPFFANKHSQTSLGYNLGAPVWLKRNNNISDDESSMQASLRFEQFFESFEYALHYLRHINTEVNLVAFDSENGKFTPNYFETTEVGFTSKIKGEKINYKLESSFLSYSDFEEITTIYGNRTPEDHIVVALGLERSAEKKKSSKFNWLVELQTVLGLEEEQKSEQYLYQSDLYMGLDYNFKDDKRTELTTGFIIDLERDTEQVFELAFARNYNEKIRYDFLFRMTNAPIKEDIPVNNEVFHNTNFLLFNLSYQL